MYIPKRKIKNVYEIQSCMALPYMNSIMMQGHTLNNIISEKRIVQYTKRILRSKG